MWLLLLMTVDIYFEPVLYCFGYLTCLLLENSPLQCSVVIESFDN